MVSLSSSTSSQSEPVYQTARHRPWRLQKLFAERREAKMFLTLINNQDLCSHPPCCSLFVFLYLHNKFFCSFNAQANSGKRMDGDAADITGSDTW